MAVSGVLFSEAVTFSDTRQFQGQFDPTLSRQPLVLPAQIPLAAVLVHEGEDVKQGQRVALFDQKQLEGQISHLRSVAAVNALERECLLSSAMTLRLPVEETDSQNGANLEAKAALRRCRLRHRENALARERLTQTRQELSTRAAITHREALERLRLTPPAFRRVLSLRAAIERGALDAAVAELDLEMAEEVLSQDRKVQADVRSLEIEARDLNRKISFFESYYKTPHLIAPQPGRVTRVRHLPLHEGFVADTTLVHLETELPGHYSATMTMPINQAELLPQGARVFVRFSGLPSTQPPLAAHATGIQRVFTSDAGEPLALVGLELRLDSLKTGNMQQVVSHLRGGLGRSTITAKLADSTLISVVRPSIERIRSYF
ncbi:hypothetical protein [Shimia sp. Alg240-R146]|uniref:hypothetical protein n=1 Tax=Shimia sp. Alg240-R146 TaxID=2993449 RepID=UPI0022E15728|nr:hypothetical protein [Shimia sp. Alg240-R146]